MNNIIKTIQQKYQTGDMNQCIEGLEIATVAVNEIVDMSIKLFEKKNLDMFLITERVSAFFDNYLKMLNQLADSEEKDLKFWASCLLVHHCISNAKAEDGLLNEVKYGEIEKAEIATTILARNRNSFLVDAIDTRLKQKEGIDDSVIKFFEEKKYSLNKQ